MLQAFGGTSAEENSGLTTPLKTKGISLASTPIGALSAVTGVFSSSKTRESVSQLKAEIEELKKLERLRPQLMELQQRIVSMRNDAEENDKKWSEDCSNLREHNQELAAALKQCQKIAEKHNSEKDDALSLANEWSLKAEKAEREVRRLNDELDDFRERMAELSAKVVNPKDIENLNEKILELESKFWPPVFSTFLITSFYAEENKHWQRMAQNLSKDVQKLSGTADSVHIKEENVRLQRRLEVCW